jgi:2'-hydroxyisoflavone reductase
VKILVLGGTGFIGRHIVAICLDRGDHVTLLHRGRSPSPFGDVVRDVLADRRAPGATAARVLAQHWDAVIDTSARDVTDLRPLLALLGPTGQYVMLSTCGVYRRKAGTVPPLTERSPTILAETTDPTRVSAVRKLRCERLLRRRLDRNRTPWLIARLGLVVGTGDTSQRLAYWLERALRGGDLLVPMHPAQPLSVIDAGDVARFLRDELVRQSRTGMVNVAGPPGTAADLLDTCTTHACRPMTPCWVDERLALGAGLSPWTEIPLWLPATTGERSLMTVSSARAAVLGLTCRPLGDTIADCLAWHAVRRDWSSRWLEPARERRLLRHWGR